MNIAEVIINKLATIHAEIYLQCDNQDLSYHGFIKKIKITSLQLRQAGIKKGDRVFVFADTLDYWSDLVAVWCCGAVAVPIEKDIKLDKLSLLIEIVSPIYALGATSIIGHTSLIRVSRQREVQEELFSIEQLEPNEMAAIYFTSGSTGMPKGAVLTQASILGNAFSTLKKIGLTEKNHLCIATPFHFTSAICHFLSTALSGARLTCTLRKLIYRDLYNYIIQSAAESFAGSPIQLNWINECLSGNEKITWLMSSGDHLNTSIIQELLKKLPNLKLFVVYGLTELSGRYCIMEPQFLAQYPGSVGKPIEGLTLSILNEDEETVTVNEVGYIYAGGDFLMQGYFPDVARTSSSFKENRFKTGDMGYYNQDGFLYLSGRQDDVFKCAGQKVSTLPISDALRECAIFNDFVVLPFEQAGLGWVPCVYYVLKQAAVFEQGVVLKKLRQTLDSLHLPQRFIEVDHIPRTGSGKVNRKELELIAKK